MFNIVKQGAGAGFFFKFPVLYNFLSRSGGIVIFIFFLSGMAAGQNSSITIPDSIIRSLDTLSTAVDKLDFLNLTNRSLARKEPDLAFRINDYALTLAKEFGEQKMIGLVYLERGILYSIIGDHTNARPFFKEAETYYKEERDSMRLGYIYRNIAIGFSHEGVQDSALNYCYGSLYYLDPSKESDKEILTLTLNTLANILYHNNIYRFAIKYAEAAAKIAKEIDNDKGLASSYNIISLCLLELEESGSLDFLEESYKLHVKNKDSTNIIVSINNYGFYLLESGKFKEGLDTLLKGLEQNYKWGKKDFSAYYKAGISRAYYLLGDYSKAEEYLLELIDQYDNKGGLTPYKIIYETLAKVREKQGRYKEALELLYIAHEIEVDELKLESKIMVDIHERDLANNKKLKQLNYLQTKNELTQKELILKNRNLLLLWIFILGLSCIMGLLFYFIRRLNQSKLRIERINKELSEQSLDLKVLNQSKENLISVIGHDLRGPLGNLRELLYMIPADGDVISPESRNILNLSQGSVEQMNDLLANLLVWAKSQKRKLLLDRQVFILKEVVERVKDLYGSFLSFRNITLSIDIDRRVTVYADPDTVEIVIRNLINNSIKYSPSDAKIFLSAFYEGGKPICILEDEAGGIPEQVVNKLFNNGLELQAQEPTIINGGFGLKLSQELLVANGAYWTYEKTASGSKITIYFDSEPS